jgi:hypothetical protein
MYLIPFPSEILCFASVILTWVYVVLGIASDLKFNQASTKEADVTNQIVCSNHTNSTVNHKTFYYNCFAEKSETQPKKPIQFVKISNLRVVGDFIYTSIYLNSNQELRGPPMC